MWLATVYVPSLVPMGTGIEEIGSVYTNREPKVMDDGQPAS
jgi:hypothetical protein